MSGAAEQPAAGAPIASDIASLTGVITPSLDEVRALAGGEHNLIPLRQTFIEDTETPVSAFLKLRGAGPAFLLESAEQGQRVGRCSFIGYKPRSVVRWSLGDDGDPYALAAAAVARYRQAPSPGLPPFAGGAVGFFGYDFVRTVETTLGEPNPDTIGLPDMALMLSDVLVAFDHLKHTTTVLANVDLGRRRRGRLQRAVEAIAEVRGRLAGPLPAPDAPRRERPEPQFESNMTREAVRGDGRARSSSTSTPATPSRSCPSQRWSAPASPSSRSRSTAACAPSTRRRTCTSWTSRTSRSSAPRPSRC